MGHGVGLGGFARYCWVLRGIFRMCGIAVHNALLFGTIKYRFVLRDTVCLWV